MNKNAVIKKTAEYIRRKCAGDSSGHDWRHIERVWKMALRLGRKERADLFIVQLGALLHDIADWKFYDGDDEAGPAQARGWLKKFEVPEEMIRKIESIIREVSYKGAQVATPMSTFEGKVVQDADRLDAIGAIGIARAFAYGGHAGRPMYDPDVPPSLHSSFDAYKKSRSHTVNHFYEKLLLLKDRMNTKSERRVARSRHAYMKKFLEELFLEWKAQDARL